MFRFSYRGRVRNRTRCRQGFALRDLLAMICCLSMLGMLGCMWINDAHISSNRSGCLSNIRQLALSVANYESANERFPVVTDATAPLHAVPPGTLADDTANSSGYGWLVRMLPYIEETILMDELVDSSERFSVRPFDVSASREDGTHFSTVQLSAFRCPAIRGEATVQPGVGSEYDAHQMVGGYPAITSYMAIVGTHVSEGQVVENGVIVSRCVNAPETCDGRSVTLRDVGDGISNTLILCETTEPVYAAWIDGQATWVVGIEPGGVGKPDDAGHPTAQATTIDTFAYSASALPDAWPGRLTRDRGPSSDHPGGAVMHAFADAHTKALSPDIDPTVYYRLITRNGGEPVDLSGL